MPEKNRENLSRHYSTEKGPISWKELEFYFANGTAVYVSPDLNLVEVAVSMALDETDRFREWMQNLSVHIVSDEQARDWIAANRMVEAVVVSPYVLVRPL